MMRYEEYGYQGTPEEIAQLMKLKKELEKDEPKPLKEPDPPAPPWEASIDKLKSSTSKKRRFRRG